MTPSNIHLDYTIEQIGGCGRYQVYLALIVHSMKLIMCFSMIFMVFGAAVPDWWCADDFPSQNASDFTYTRNNTQYKSCRSGNGTGTCKQFVFDQNSMRTVISEWDLVCNNAWVPSTIVSIQMVGVLVGNVICGQVADLVGRKLPLFVSIFTLVVLNVVAAFSVSWIMFAIIRLFIGLAMGFQLTVQYNILSEFTLARWRTWMVSVPTWAIGLALFAATAWLIHDWQYLHVATAIVGAPMLATFWFVPESFRWYFAHDRMHDAHMVIERVAKFNRRPVPDSGIMQTITDTEKSEAILPVKDKKYTVVDLFRSRELIKTTLLLLFICVSALSGNLFINIFIVAVLGSPLQFPNIYLQNRIGRKKTAIIFFVVFCVTAFMVGIAQRFEESPVRDKMSNAAAIISLTAINGAWSPIQTITIELYPTVVRNIGYGLQNTMARVGAIIGPQLVFLDSKVSGMMYIVCGVAAVISIATIVPLRETKGSCLNDNISNEKTTPALDEESS